MARKNQDINPLLIELKNSLTEEDILKHLIKLVKKFDPYQYKQVIYDNPYYKREEAGIGEYYRKGKQIVKKKKMFVYVHLGFWQCMDTLRDKILLNKLW